MKSVISNAISRSGAFLGYAIAILLAIIPISYSLTHLSDSNYRDSMMANWLATLLGVIIGIPIALLLNRRNQEEEEKRKRLALKQEAKARKIEILERVKTELEYNAETLEHREKGINESADPGVHLNSSDIIKNSLKVELWDALRYGGELEWIKELQLLDDIASAYHQVRTIAFVEERYIVEDFSGRDFRKSSVANKVRDAIPEARTKINHALQGISNAVPANRSDSHK